jgi:hypothetical protein
LQTLFQSAQHFYEKKEGFGFGAGSVLMTHGSRCGSWRLRNIRIRMWIWNAFNFLFAVQDVEKMHEVHEEELAKVQLDHRGLVSRDGALVG